MKIILIILSITCYILVNACLFQLQITLNQSSFVLRSNNFFPGLTSERENYISVFLGSEGEDNFEPTYLLVPAVYSIFLKLQAPSFINTSLLYEFYTNLQPHFLLCPHPSYNQLWESMYFPNNFSTAALTIMFGFRCFKGLVE